MTARVDGQRPVDNAVVVARRASSESWRIGDRPMVASPCRCESPVWERDEVGSGAYQLGTMCRSAGGDTKSGVWLRTQGGHTLDSPANRSQESRTSKRMVIEDGSRTTTEP